MPQKNSGPSPLDKAKEALNTISGLPPIDIDNLITSLLKKTENNATNQADWKNVYQALSSDNKNEDINNIVKHISSLDFISSYSQMERLAKYQEFITILKKVPIIKKILRLYTANILAPDDISKVSLKTVPKNPTIDKFDETYISIDSKYRTIMDKIDLEDNLYNLIFKTLFYGDMFAEILSSKRYLLQTLYNLQIPIKDEYVKLSESMDSAHNTIDTINLFDPNDKKSLMYQINIDWQKPIGRQINETKEFALSSYKKILNTLHIDNNNINTRQKYGILRYITETMFGDTELIDDIDKFKAFNEGFEVANNDSDSDNFEDKQYALDYMPMQLTLASLNIKIHTPDKIIILKDDEIEYGYLYINEGISSVNNKSKDGSSSISTNGVSADSVIRSTNFLSPGSAGNSNMFTNGGGNNANNKVEHARQISNRIYQYIKAKFEEYDGNVDINNMSPNLQQIIADILVKGSNCISVRYIPPLNMQHFKIEGTGFNAPYGEGVVEDLLFRAKMLLADDINAVITKLIGSGKRMLWTVTAKVWPIYLAISI